MNDAKFLDLECWPRRAAYEHFRGLAQPIFSLCASVNMDAMAQRLKSVPGATPFLIYHHAALKAANAVENFRYRLAEQGVRVHAAVDGSTTVLRENQSIGFANLRFETRLGDFVAGALPVLASAKRVAPELGGEPLGPRPLIYMTTLPWLHFSSFTHARGESDWDVPKLAFGRIEIREGRALMPVGVEVHHALMDGLHVAQFYAAMQAALDDPG